MKPAPERSSAAESLGFARVQSCPITFGHYAIVMKKQAGTYVNSSKHIVRGFWLAASDPPGRCKRQLQYDVSRAATNLYRVQYLEMASLVQAPAIRAGHFYAKQNLRIITPIMRYHRQDWVLCIALDSKYLAGGVNKVLSFYLSWHGNGHRG